MKRKLISFCTAVVMGATCISSVYAAPTTVKEIITSLEDYDTKYKEVALEVDSDIEVRNGGNAYADGPLTVSVSSSNPRTTFDYKATLYMKAVRDEFRSYWNRALLLCSGDTALETDLNNIPVTGEFTVKITYPSSVTIPEYIKQSGSMIGFNNESKNVFKDVERIVDNNSLTIKIKVKDPSDADKEYILGKDLNENLDSYLADLTFTCTDVIVNGVGTHRVKGEVTGFTKIGDYNVIAGTAGDPISTITYTAVQDDTNTRYTDTDDIVEDVSLVTSAPTPYNGGGGSGRSSGGGLIAGNSSPIPTTSTEPTIIPSTPVTTAELERGNHFAYIIGYPEGDVRPENNITRAEIATILFRMLSDDSRVKSWSTSNNYSDVTESDWFNNAISTVSAANIVNGYDDGTFKPNAPITRAEFAAIIARFIGGVYMGADRFSDINGHWAAEAINRARTYGWISGYEDNTYRPDRNITRAEAMTLMNNVLNRHVAEDGMIEDMIKWSDNTSDKWYYTAVQEATNSHYYERTEGEAIEKWTSMRDPRNWAALETETANANSAGHEESVLSGE